MRSSLNAQTLHAIYVLIDLTASKNTYTCFGSMEFYVLISLLDLDTRQNMHTKNEAVLVHYKEDVSVSVFSKIISARKKFQLVVNFVYNVKCHGFFRYCFIH